MLLPEQWEIVAAERRRDWEKESEQQRLLAQIPKEPRRWRQWTGSFMVWAGMGLMCLGERLATRKSQEGVSTAG